MKNIYEILKSAGLEVPEDKKAEFDKALSEFGAKNNTAAKALLDLKTLRESKNQAEDI